MNLMRRSDAMSTAKESLKSVKNHNLNSDESNLKRSYWCKKTRKYFTWQNEASFDHQGNQW